MRTMLLFPPTWHPSQPYLSLPSLTGFLKQEGVTDIIQRDLGIEVLDSFLSQATGRETYERMQEKVRTLERLGTQGDRKSTRLNSSHLVISYAVFCLKKKKNK